MIERQFDEQGDEYLNSEEIFIDIWINKAGHMMIEKEDELLIIPSEVLNGVLSFKK